MAAVQRLLTGRSAQFADGAGPGSETLEQARAAGDSFTGGDVYWDGSRKIIVGARSSDTDEHFLQVYSDKGLIAEVIDASSIGSASPGKISVQQGGVERWSFRQDGKFEVATEGINFNGDILPLTDATKLIGDSAHRVNKVATANGYEVYLAQSDTYAHALYGLTGMFIGPGGTDIPDSRLYRPSVAAWTFDDAAGGDCAVTVNGATYFTGSGPFLDSSDGIAAAVAPANHGRIRYNNTTKTWQGSVDTGAYTDFGSGGSGPWTLTGTDIHPTVTTNKVVLGQYVGPAAAIWDSFTNVRVTLRGESDVNGGPIYLIQYADDTADSQGEFTAQRARGTIAAPTAVQADDRITRFGAVGYNGTGTVYVGSMDIIAENNYSGTDCRAYFQWKTGGSTPSEKLRLTNFGILKASNTQAFGTPLDFAIDNVEVDIGVGGQSDATLRQLVFRNSSAAAKVWMNANVDTGQYLEFVINNVSEAKLSATEFFSAVDVRIPNNKFLNTKTTGGTQVSIIGMASDDIIYVGDESAGTNHVWLLSNTLDIGYQNTGAINMKSTVRAFGETGGTNGTTAFLMGNNKTFSAKTTGGTVLDLIGLYPDDVIYLGDTGVGTNPVHLISDTITLGYTSSSGIVKPFQNNKTALGDSGHKFTTLWSVALNTGDIHLDNEEMDSRWTLREATQEGEDPDCLYFINRRVFPHRKYKLDPSKLLEAA